MITVIDTTAYAHCSPRNYKQIPVDQAIPEEPCVEFSRYEVLQQKIRKMYFDFDGIPNDNYNLLREFVEDYNNFLISKDYIKEPIEFISTINTRSANHPGIGSHIIAKAITMDATKQHTLLLAFFSEHEGAEKYKPYVDTSVYSVRQLFKLPHFIGLPMVDTENYHCMVDTEDRSAYIIQKITNCKYLNPNINAKQEWKKNEHHISYIPHNNNGMMKTLCDIVLNRRSANQYNTHKYIDRCQLLLTSENITEGLARRLNKIIIDLQAKRNIETSIGLIEHIAKKLDAE